MTDKQLAANKANAQKAGRPPGKLLKEVIAARRAIKMTLMERCQQNELEFVETLEGIARDLTQPANARIGALGCFLTAVEARLLGRMTATV
jgi:hypothetical protein